MVTQKGSSSYSSSPLPSKGKEVSPGECSSPQWQWGRNYKIHPEDVIMAALDHQMPTWRVVEAPGAVVVFPQCRPLLLGSINAGTAAKSMLSPGRSKEETPISRTTAAPRKRGSVRGAAAKAVFTRVRNSIDILHRYSPSFGICSDTSMQQSSTFAEVPCESPSPLLAQQTSRTRNRGEVAAMVLKKVLCNKLSKISCKQKNVRPHLRARPQTTNATLTCTSCR